MSIESRGGSVRNNALFQVEGLEEEREACVDILGFWA